MDYRHGTGHGVGSLLCVHEGPIGISRGNKTVLEEGMCISNEPGFYKDGEFGIRIENIMMVQKHPSIDGSLYFENLTKAPYCRELIETNLMSTEFIDHVNYYSEVCQILLQPHIEDDKLALDYVER